jgi:hypothetical protein
MVQHVVQPDQTVQPVLPVLPVFRLVLLLLMLLMLLKLVQLVQLVQLDLMAHRVLPLLLPLPILVGQVVQPDLRGLNRRPHFIL